MEISEEMQRVIRNEIIAKVDNALGIRFNLYRMNTDTIESSQMLIPHIKRWTTCKWKSKTYSETIVNDIEEFITDLCGEYEEQFGEGADVIGLSNVTMCNDVITVMLLY